MALALDAYGTECLEWDPDTLISEVQQDNSVDLPQVNKDKLSAMMTLLTTDSFYRDPIVFYQTCLCFNERPCNFQGFNDDLSAADMAWVVTEAGLNDVDEKGHMSEFSDDVAAFVGVVLRQDGFFSPPQILSFAKMRPPNLDRASAQAQSVRDQNAHRDLEQYLQVQLESLNLELSSLPLGSPAASPSKGLPGHVWSLIGRDRT
jgi:hypothetical protein